MARSNRSMSATRPGDDAASARNASASDAWPDPWTTIRAPRASSSGAASASRSKPFCGSSRPIIPITGPSSAGSNPTRPSRSARQAALPARSPRAYGAARSRSVAGSQTDVSRPLRIPMNRSPRCAQQARPGPSRTRASAPRAAKPGETVFTSSAALDAGGEQVDAVGVLARTAVPRPQARAGAAPTFGVQPW